MARVLVDSSVILDIVTNDAEWGAWSADAVARGAETGTLMINPIIYAEVSVGFKRIEEVEAAVPAEYFQRVSLPWEAAFLAGKSFLRYRRWGGGKQSPLPDFYIGAHAAVSGLSLLICTEN